MDNTTEHKTRRKAKAMNGIALTPPKQTLPQPAAWQKREPPMQVILRRLKAYEHRLKRIISMCDNVSIGLIADAAVDLTLIKEIAEGKHDK
jgi:hypothetical protein